MRDYANYFNDRELPEKRGVEMRLDIDSRVAFFTRHITKSLFAILLILIALTITLTISAGKNSEKFPLKKINININGDTSVTTRKDINTALVGLTGDSFLSVNLNDISSKLTNIPWISYASVERSWPNTLTVNLVERQAAYRWGNNELVDREGNRFKRVSQTNFNELPQLSGASGSEIKVIEAYKFLMKNLGAKASDLAIDKFTLNKHLSWKLRLKSGVVVIFGRNDYAQRVVRFSDAIKVSKLPKLQQLDILDFRYTDGFAVTWKPEFQQKSQNGKLVKVRASRGI